MEKTEKEAKVPLAIEMIIDNSGSMGPLREKVVRGVNKFIEELSGAILPARLGVTLFDDVLRATLIDGMSVAEQPRMKVDEYPANWGTENIAHSVIQALERLAPVDAEQKVLVVMTDGLNSSSQMAKAKALVAKRQSEGWLIIWFGVYVEHYEHEYKPLLLKYAAGLGIPEGQTYALPSRKIDKAVPFAASAALRWFGSGGDTEAAAFTAKERAI